MALRQALWKLQGIVKMIIMQASAQFVFEYRFYGSSSYSDFIFSMSFYIDAQKAAGQKVWLVFFSYWFSIFIKHLLSQHLRNSIHFQSLFKLHSLNLWLLSPKWGNLSLWHLPKLKCKKGVKNLQIQSFSNFQRNVCIWNLEVFLQRILPFSPFYKPQFSQQTLSRAVQPAFHQQEVVTVSHPELRVTLRNAWMAQSLRRAPHPHGGGLAIT